MKIIDIKKEKKTIDALDVDYDDVISVLNLKEDNLNNMFAVYQKHINQLKNEL